ncbi:MAG: hotdog fold thioesterase [Flavobacteriaceae bacterium]|nr:hotdog fold thioesterase [Flavobacteriaceae bacterium]
MENADKLALLNKSSQNYLIETLGISFTELGDDYLVAKMPVNERVYQPDGVLHGGATFALAETVGSVASYLFAKTDDQIVRGIEMSGNHLRSVSSGYVHARAESIHKGRTTQIWQIRVTDDEDQLISLLKLTTITLPKK